MLTRIIVVLFVLVVGFAIVGADGQTVIKRVSPSPTSPASGPGMFKSYCAACHGLDGKGDGPAVAALKAPPPDLTTLSARNEGKFPELRVYSVIHGDLEVTAHGSKEMPVWSSIFQSMGRDNGADTQMRIANLVGFIKGLQSK